jgi:hypothetical protein
MCWTSAFIFGSSLSSTSGSGCVSRSSPSATGSKKSLSALKAWLIASSSGPRQKVIRYRHSASVGGVLRAVMKPSGSWYIAAACWMVIWVASANWASSSEIGIGISSAPPPTPMTLPARPEPLCCASTDLIQRLPVSSSTPSGNFRPMPGKIPFARWRSSNSARLRPADTSSRAAVIGASPSSPSPMLKLRIWMISSVPRVIFVGPVVSSKTTSPVAARRGLILPALADVIAITRGRPGSTRAGLSLRT